MKHFLRIGEFPLSSNKTIFHHTELKNSGAFFEDTTTQNTVVEFVGVSKDYEGKSALGNISFSVQTGEFITILGPSGCGKTTALRLLAGFDEPDEGQILLGGSDMADIPPEEREVNTIFQNYALFPHMTVFDNVAFGLRMEGMPSETIRSVVDDMLVLVRLDGLRDRKPEKLSGGQQQRVAIARALVKKPLVLLLDEPLSALDYRLRKDMQIELKQLQRRLGITFIQVTHDQEEAFAMSDRVVVMNEGDIVQIGTPREIYEEPANLYVAKFVGEINIFHGVVLNQSGSGYSATVEGVSTTVHTTLDLSPGSKILLLLRPEDFQIETLGSLGQASEMPHGFEREDCFLGEVVSTAYKGATYDLEITLDNGKMIQVTKFFDEDSDGVAFGCGDRVVVHWIPGWEVVFPDNG